MVFNIEYSDSFSPSECDKLKSFEGIIKEEWVQNSNSAASLLWEVKVLPKEPRLNVVLKVKSNNRVLHVESCDSFCKKTNEKFRAEFIESAINYFSCQSKI